MFVHRVSRRSWTHQTQPILSISLVRFNSARTCMYASAAESFWYICLVIELTRELTFTSDVQSSSEHAYIV